MNTEETFLTGKSEKAAEGSLKARHTPFDQAAFIRWIRDKHFLRDRLQELSDIVIEFAEQKLADRGHAIEIAGSLWDVVNRCNDIAFESSSQADAYGFMHFVDRYQRAFETCLYLLEKNCWPKLRDRFHCLDIGTGPGPVLYALSDLHHQIREFLGRNRENDPRPPTLLLDYVERANGFRNWLHHFTEIANVRTAGARWDVPFHFGSFRNYSNIQFDAKLREIDYDDDGDEFYKPFIRRHRFSLIMAANFLTSLGDVARFSEEIKQSIRYLKNTGIFVCIGAASTKAKYAKIYSELETTITTGRYSNWRYMARSKLHLAQTLCRESDSDSTKILGSYFARLMGLLNSKRIWEFVPSGAKTYLKHGSQMPSICWEVRVFRKQSRLWPKRGRASENGV